MSSSVYKAYATMKQKPQTHLNIALIATFVVAIAGLLLTAQQDWQAYRNSQQVHQLILATNNYIEATKALTHERGRSFLYLSNLLKDKPTQHKAFILQQRQIADEQLDQLFALTASNWPATLTEIEHLKQQKQQLDELRYQISEQFEYASLPDNQLAEQNVGHLSRLIDQLENLINRAANQTTQIPGNIASALRMSIVLNRWRESIQSEAPTMIRASRMLIDSQLHDQLAAQDIINQDKTKNARRMTLANRNSTEHLADIEHIQQVYQAQIVPLRQQLLNPALEKPSIDAIIAAYAKVLSEFNQKTSGIFADLQQLDAEQQQQVISDIRLDVMTTIITLLLMGYLLFVIRRQVLAPLEQLHTILNTTVDSIITIDDKGIIETVNAASLTLFGYSENELIGNNITILMPADVAQHHDGYLKHYLEHTETPRIIGIGREVTGKRKDGSTFAMHLSVGVNRQANRTNFVGVIRNLEHEKETIATLSKTQDKLQQAYTMAQIGHWQANLITGELYWSDEIYRIFGFDSATFTPSVEAFLASVHPDDLRMVEESERRAQETGQHDIVHRIIRPDGMIRYVHELAQAESDATGTLIGLTGTV